MKKYIKSNNFTGAWMTLCVTAFGWSSQLKEEYLKVVVICSILLISGIFFVFVSDQRKKGKRKRKKVIT